MNLNDIPFFGFLLAIPWWRNYRVDVHLLWRGTLLTGDENHRKTEADKKGGIFG